MNMVSKGLEQGTRVSFSLLSRLNYIFCVFICFLKKKVKIIIIIIIRGKTQVRIWAKMLENPI